MTSILADLLLNILLIVLLGATIGYCYILNRKIQTLQNSKSEFASLLKHFDDSTIKASETIIAMQTASKKIGENIQMRIEKANYLLDDLSYTIEKASRLSNQIDASFAINRARDKVIQENSLQREISQKEDWQIEAEEIAIAKSNSEKPSHKNSNKRNISSLEAMVEKVMKRNKAQNSPEHKSQEHKSHLAVHSEAPSSRSRAEQELIDLIRSNRQ